MLNTITLMGRLTRDPELRNTQSGTAVTSFSLAVERDTAERQADFFNCVAWKTTAEFVARNFRKGMLVVVSGRLQIREWTDKNNATRREAEVVVSNCYFGEPKRTGDANVTPPMTEIGDEDGELPF